MAGNLCEVCGEKPVFGRGYRRCGDCFSISLSEHADSESGEANNQEFERKINAIRLFSSLEPVGVELLADHGFLVGYGSKGSNAFSVEENLEKAHQTALRDLRKKAVRSGANGVVGVRTQLVSFDGTKALNTSGGTFGVIVEGNAVFIS